MLYQGFKKLTALSIGHHHPNPHSCLLRGFINCLLLLPRRRTESVLYFSQSSQIQPRAQEDNTKVEADEDPENAVVEPLVRVVNIEACGLHRDFISTR